MAPSSPEVGIGASDSLLLIVSGIGFCFLAWTVYSIILTKLKTAKEFDDEQDEVGYEERLAQADVASLNRAQRRARARHIMRQQRRVAPMERHQIHGVVDGDNIGAVNPNNNNNNGDDPNHHDVNDDNNEPPVQDIPPMNPNNINDAAARAGVLLSRKERVGIAKLLEREERRVLEDVRRKEQEKAQEVAKQQKKDKGRLQSLRDEEDRQRRRIQKEDEERALYDAWRIFLPPPGLLPPLDDNGTSSSSSSSSKSVTPLTVKEWIHELEHNRFASVKSLAERFQVSPSQVRKRIQELVATGRLSGILEEEEEEDNNTPAAIVENEKDGRHYDFIYLAPKEMAALASFVMVQDKITPKDLQQHIMDEILLKT